MIRIPVNWRTKDVRQVSRFEVERVDLAITALLDNQPVASELERARDKCQSAVVTSSVNLSFSFLSRVSRRY